MVLDPGIILITSALTTLVISLLCKHQHNHPLSLTEGGFPLIEINTSHTCLLVSHPFSQDHPHVASPDFLRPDL